MTEKAHALHSHHNKPEREERTTGISSRELHWRFSKVTRVSSLPYLEKYNRIFAGVSEQQNTGSEQHHVGSYAGVCAGFWLNC
jgi:hypothetical protein